LNICILSYNHPEVTSRAVRSALQHFDRPVLIHNGSLPAHVDQLRQRFPKVQHVVIPQNMGYSGGVNRGLKEVFKISDWTIFLSNDCELISLPRIPARPGIIVPKIFRRHLQTIDSVAGGFLPSQGKLRHFRSVSEFQSATGQGWIPYVPGSAFLIHKNVFEIVGDMDPALGTYWDDVDWSVRAGSLGFSISVDESFQVLHRVGKTCHKNPLYSIYYFQRNRKKISWKYCAPSLKPVLAARLAVDWIRIGSRMIRAKRFKDLSHLKNALLD